MMAYFLLFLDNPLKLIFGFTLNYRNVFPMRNHSSRGLKILESFIMKYLKYKKTDPKIKIIKRKGLWEKHF
jgi:hypothetical protein